MMWYRLLLLLPVLMACAEKSTDSTAVVDTYNIDPGRISISGISSGAYMAGQVHLAHAELFSGIGMVAGGPYYCAAGELSRALGACTKGGELDVDAMLAYAKTAAAAGRIDDLRNLANDRVWVFHGVLDAAVDLRSSEAAAALYSELIAEDAVTSVSDIAVVHGFPTLDTGQPCDVFAAPFLNSCDYDAAGAILSALYGTLHARRESGGELLSVAQPGFDAAEMLPTAFAYVPTSCSAGAACGVHVALHGCSQSSEYIEEAFASGAGYNEWANANELIVLYPQVASSKLAPMNPYGCWDWWGYTGEQYATKEGPQIAAIKALLDSLAGTTL